MSFNGATITQDTDFHFIQDRRSPYVTAMIQLQPFTGRPDWYKADPDWWYKNLDTWSAKWGNSGMPNDVVITGIIGMPILTDDTWHAIVEMTGYLFKQKDAASNVVFGPDGTILDIGDLPTPVQAWIVNWRIRTAVGVI